jgi:capA domain protein
MPGGPLEHTVDKETLERIQSTYNEVNELLNIKF